MVLKMHSITMMINHDQMIHHCFDANYLNFSLVWCKFSEKWSYFCYCRFVCDRGVRILFKFTNKVRSNQRSLFWLRNVPEITNWDHWTFQMIANGCSNQRSDRNSKSSWTSARIEAPNWTEWMNFTNIR